MESQSKKLKVVMPDKKEKVSYHLWGVRNMYKVNDKNIAQFVTKPTWQYIKDCPPSRRALAGIDTRLYSQLEVRSSENGKQILTFIEVDEYRV